MVLPVRIPSCCSHQGSSCLVFSVVQKKWEGACDSARKKPKVQQIWMLLKAKEYWWLIIQHKLHKQLKLFLLYYFRRWREYGIFPMTSFFFFFLFLIVCTVCVRAQDYNANFFICAICFVGLNLSTQMEKDEVLLLN